MIDREPFVGWEIVNEIGKGSYSTVFIAKKDNAFSAIKQIIIPNDEKYNYDYSRLRGNADKILELYKPEVESLLKEVKTLIKLCGFQGIVVYHDHLLNKYSLRAGWELLIRMEYLEPLDKYVNKNGITIGQVLKLGIDICCALELCYNEGILHRDIKESNILVDSRGNFKLCDFGVSKSLKDKSEVLTITGTYGYMAPEVERGEKYDHRADIYSLGVVLYGLLNEWVMPYSGRQEYTKGSNRKIISLLKNQDIKDPIYGNELIAKVIKKACLLKKESRYTTFEKFKNALNIAYNKTNDRKLKFYAIKPLNVKENNCKLFSLYDKLTEDTGVNTTNFHGNDLSISSNKEDYLPYTQETYKRNNTKKPKFAKYLRGYEKVVIILVTILLHTIFASSIAPLTNSYLKKYSHYSIFNKHRKMVNTHKKNKNYVVGNYFYMGKYYDAPILWKCHKIDRNGLLLVSEKILCLKAFDSAESGDYGKGSSNKEKLGDSKWEKSNLREWLNCKDDVVKYSSKPPDKSGVFSGYNAYASEPGFLKSFNQNEIPNINLTSHGELEDYVFILSKSEIDTLWSEYAVRRRVPTEQAIKNSDYKNEKLKLNYTWWYWTRDFDLSKNFVSFVDGDGTIDKSDYPSNGLLGVLPALYMKDSVKSEKGTGKINNPYIITKQ